MLFIRKLVVTISSLLMLAACDPVVPVEPITSSRFESFDVHGYIPPSPVGIVYLFHGTGGSAGMALKIETIDQTNELVSRGYGWIATESTERTGNKRWNVFDASLATNPDLARLARLHAYLIANTDVNDSTPIYGIGMSNGARMVTLFGQSFAESGYPVAAVAPFNGRAALPVKVVGGLTVPGFWVSSENDNPSTTEGIIADQQASAMLGTTTQLVVKPEEPLLPLRFTRISAIDPEEAVEIYHTLQGTGAWDENGKRLIAIEPLASMLEQLPLAKNTGATASQIMNQIRAMLAVHQFVGYYRVPLADFFDAQRE